LIGDFVYSAMMAARRVIALDAAVRGGRRHFLRDGTLDVDLLARELAVSRATLYRVVGSRDALLGDVLWTLGRRLLDLARGARARGGAEGVLDVSRVFAWRLAMSPPMRRFLETEPQTASRVLFTPAGGVHDRAVRAQARIFAESGLPGGGSGAVLYVRLMESVIYGEFLEGSRIPFADAEPSLRALLRD
jgi:hypothetical protein